MCEQHAHLPRWNARGDYYRILHTLLPGLCNLLADVWETQQTRKED